MFKKQIPAQEIWKVLLNHKLRQVLHIFYLKRNIIVNKIKKILEQLNHPIYVVKF